MSWKVIDVDETSIVNKYHVGKLTAELIAASQLSEEKIRELLYGDERITTSHADCVLQACDRIRQARINHEKIFVGGDYDADGICSTAIMKEVLNIMGIENGYYIPDRFKEGYGLSPKTVEAAHEKGYDIIMTVDNGVKAHAALQRAKQLGMYVIVTDHHEIEEEIEADIVVHPNYLEEEYRYLSGAGVALQLARNLLGESSAYDYLITLCAIALIGDVMPMWAQNRAIIKKGLSLLRQRTPKSAYALLRPGTTIDETAIAFQVVPKLNSVGRMNDISNVNTLIPFLLCKDENTIARYVSQLNLVNESRKELSQTQSEKAKMYMDQTKNIQVIYDESFHEGICGLVAGKLANEFHQPTLVFAKNDDVIKGSGRSVPGFNMFAFFSDFEETVAFGGHEQAVGIAIHQDNFETFKQHVYDKFENEKIVIEDVEKCAIRINEDEITFDDISDISRLSPYPKDMFTPYFCLENPTIIETKKTAKTQKYIIQVGSGTLEAVLYQNKNILFLQNPKRIIGSLSINRFRQKISLQMIIEDME